MSPAKPTRRRKPLIIGGEKIPLGKTTNVRLKVSETYFGDDVSIHLQVIRAKRPGPTVFVTAAIHGDELNGVGVVHDLLFDDDLKLKCGTLILVPVVNVFGFENGERYLPDRRDLNRSFPGSATGSLASRLAHTIFQNVVKNSDYGIDLHTAAVQRTNYPNVRGRLTNPKVRRIAEAFGSELIINGAGPDGSFRFEATAAGCPTICIEAGEPWKMEPTMVQFGVRGVRNVLIKLGLIEGVAVKPPYQTKFTSTRWLRAQLGGILRFHVVPGQVVHKGQAIASNFTLLGRQQNTLTAPTEGIVLGMITLPTVKPGEPICHLGRTELSLKKIEAALASSAKGVRTAIRTRTHLATSINRVEHQKTKPRARKK